MSPYSDPTFKHHLHLQKNLEERSFENMVNYFGDVLRAIDKGANSSELLTDNQRRQLKKHGVIGRQWGQDKKNGLSERARQILDNHQSATKARDPNGR